ncbi:hypothetical protein ACPESV_24740 [Streptomyces umbrinus]|uniref:hypothetical protein n=1 Tax=Streptomyces umbrinus TaxID=67370 RepID=UPI003C30AC66
MAGTATAGLTGGLAVALYGTLANDLARTLGGTCLTLTALTAIALILIRRWIVDTKDERRILAAAQRQAEGERSRYVAARAALENEQGRLNRDMAAEKQGLAARLHHEREALRGEFEERRAGLIAETMEATVMMVRGGKFDVEKKPSGNLIPFPQQHQSAELQRERSREHGVVGP